MANPTIMLLAPMTPVQVERWTARFDALLAGIRASDVVVAGLRAWTADDDAFTPAVQPAFWDALAPWAFLADLAEELSAAPDDVHTLVTRKLSPMAVLLSGLGRRRADLLPGALGSWLLDPAGVRAAGPPVAAAFDVDSRERLEVVARLRRAVLLGDDPDVDLDDLLAMVPRAFAAAARDGRGLVCCSAVAG